MHRLFTPTWLILVCAVVVYELLLVVAAASNDPVPACPAPKLQQTHWRAVDLVRIGVRLKMPKKYAEKHWAVTVGNPILATFRAGHFEQFTLKVDGPQGQPLEQQKLIRQSDYQGYSECTETVSGHEAIIQSFRGGGVIFDTGRSYPPFAVAAVCHLRPGRILRFNGTASSRAAQEELLAIIRTLEFTR